MKHLLIDAKNMLYRAIFAAENDASFTKSGHHPINIVLHFINSWYHDFSPDQIHVFWDADRTKTWRRLINENYKGQRKDQEHIQEAQDKLGEITSVCVMFFKHLGFKQYYRDQQEADDLIFAFCRMNLNDEIIIASSDGDLKQIPYRFKNVQVCNPLIKQRKIEPVPEVDPVIFKALTGDKSDNIEGYYRVGKVRATQMCLNYKLLSEFLESDKAIIKEGEEKVLSKDQRFKENLKIIDLGLCPHLMDNMLYVAQIQSKDSEFNLTEIKKLVIKRKLRGVLNGIPRYVTPFKRLGEQDASTD